MATPSQQIVQRLKGSLTAQGALTASAPPPLVAASAPVTDTAKIFRNSGFGSRSASWQNELWELYDEVGEFAYYVDWLASSCSRVQWIASEIGEDGRPTGGIADDNPEGQKVAEIVRDLAGGTLGQAELTERSIRILAIPGEHWIAILQRPVSPVSPGSQETEERWFAVTLEEIEQGTRADTVNIVLPDGRKHEYNKDRDAVIRVWNPHPRKAMEATSPARSCLPALREIARTTAKIENIDYSRLLSAGVFLISSEANVPSAAAPTSAGKPGDPPPAPPAPQSVASSVQRQFVQIAQTAHKDPKNMAGVVPITISVPDVKNAAEHIDFGKEFSKAELEKRDNAIDRFGMGVNMSPERLRGMSTGNHWSSFVIGDSDVQLHIAPAMETLLGAVDQNVLRDTLRAEGIDPDKYVLWYDASQLTVDPDKSDEAKDAFAGNAITSDALVKASGLPADSVYDLDSPEGVKVFARDAVTKNPALLPMYAHLFSGTQGLEFPNAAQLPAGDSGRRVPSRDVSGSERGEEPDTEGGEPRAIAASAGPDAAVSLAITWGTTRALDMAGKRRVKTNDVQMRARLRDVEPHDYHRFMGPVTDSEVAALIKGWDPGLDELAGRYGFDADQVRLAVSQRARAQLTAQLVDGQVM
ncbi:Uncharacterised protein [Mycolicibacterium vanbaalenii]|uniref:Portal protein n=1 Tax=Mycolicibacterium vanbaalenii TaxID=110539 RepID=A0A5S9RAR6_MYCVN|nr:hypothetical protein [Mycolicibacterium vanbaalenii]CAA0134569.1 Uncharacterised protein [Mycolicibacterium vanbaalenii]